MSLPTGYSLWLDFDEWTFDALESRIRFWSVRDGSHAFAPHLTLLGEVGSDFERINAAAQEVARSNTEIDLRVRERGVGPAPFQSRFLSVQDSIPLCETRSQLAAALDIEERAFFPHISLQYGELETEPLLAWKIEAEPLANHLVRGVGISVVRTEGEVDQWEVAASHRLAQRSCEGGSAVS